MLQGLPCDTAGDPLPPGTLLLLRFLPESPWQSYANGMQFKTADFLFSHAKMSAGNINKLLDIWAKLMENSECPPPFHSHEHVYETIDAMQHEDAL